MCVCVCSFLWSCDFASGVHVYARLQTTVSFFFIFFYSYYLFQPKEITRKSLVRHPQCNAGGNGNGNLVKQSNETVELKTNKEQLSFSSRQSRALYKLPVQSNEAVAV